MFASLALLVLCQCTSGGDEQGVSYNEYIAAYTNGTVARKSNICVVFSQDVRQSRIDSLDVKKIFKLSPTVEGTCQFTDAHTLVFVPQNEMDRNTQYSAMVDVQSLFDNGGAFTFPFCTKPFAIRGDFDAYNVVSTDSCEVVFNLQTADIEQSKVVEQNIIVNQAGAVCMWQHSAEGLKHTLSIRLKLNDDAELTVSTKENKELGLSAATVASVPLYSNRKFSVVNMRKVVGDKCVEVTFNQKIDPKQDISGLVGFGSYNSKSYVKENKIYISYFTSDYDEYLQDVLVTINGALRSSNGLVLSEYCKDGNYQGYVAIDDDKPDVKFVGNGVIIPQSDRIVVPFRSIYMRGVRVIVFKIFSNMVGSFLQQGDMSSYSNLAIVGRPVAATTFYMDESGADLTHWHTYAIDLTKEFAVEPGAMYRVELSLDARLSAWPCDSLPTATKEEIANEDKQLLAKINSSFDTYSYYYTGKAYYQSYYWYENYYEDRKNPSSRAYYDDRCVGRNVLATNIGLTAFKGVDSNIYVAAINLPDATTMSGVSIEAYNLQRQLIGTGTTASDGLATISFNEALGQPFYIVAHNGSDVSYLNVERGGEKSTSTFDVAGDVIQKGLKGYIYGDRGVWRPGDTMYLSFMLNDKNNTLPQNHPITLQLTNPLGQVVQNITRTNGSMGLYSFSIPTEENAPTGIWTATVSVGGVSFSKNLRVETIKPNRLKIDLKVPEIIETKATNASLHTEWLNGNIASELKYDVQATIISTKTAWKAWNGYVFDNATKQFEATEQSIAKGEVGGTGNASFSINVTQQKEASGMLKCNFVTKVYEPSGEFSTDSRQAFISPYSRYVGIKSPLKEGQGHLDTNKNHTFSLASVDKDGKAVPYVDMNINVYKVYWYWWWRADKEDLAGYTSSKYNEPIQTLKAQTDANGKGTFSLNFSDSNWGTYLIEVADANGGHSTSILSYFDWPWMTSRNDENDRNNASMLSISTDKKEYEPGDKIKISFPSSGEATAIVCVSSGSSVLSSSTYKCSDKRTTIEIPATEAMMPNAYINVSLVQPYSQSVNDMPIRMYGVVPVIITSAKSHLSPIITCADEIKPESKCKITVSETDGRTMAYTLAIVDEGLLDLTHFKTPNAWDTFNAREAMGVRMWDLYDNVSGAYGGTIERMFSIGGDEALNNGPKAIVNRFTPMVYFAGPFVLKKGQKRTHEIDVPNYNGRVRVMVVATDGQAYGSAEKSMLVRRSIMLIGTMPRQIGVGDEMTVSATVFASKKVGNVDVSISASDGLQVVGNATKKINFSEAGDKTLQFTVRAGQQSGIGSVLIKASGTEDKVDYPTEIKIRSISQQISKTTSARIDAGKSWNSKIEIPGTTDYKLNFEVSANQPLNINNRLNTLLAYPHGCVEQTTSKIFPQIYLPDFCDLSAQELSEVENNIKRGVEKLRTFQTPDGGMAYWPGSNQSEMWASTYVLNFLTEAANKGYYVPEDMISKLKSYVRRNIRISDDACYGLYVLAKAQSANLSVMNLIKENENKLNASSHYLLAAAYALVSRTNVAKQLLESAVGSDQDSYWFSTDIAKLIAQTLCADANANETAEKVRAKLMSNQWLSTSQISHSLIAMSAFYKKNATSDGLKFEAMVDNKNVAKVESNKFVWNTTLSEASNSATVAINNKNKSAVYVDITAEGTAIQSQVTSLNNGLELRIDYFTNNGEVLNPSELQQSTTFRAQVSLRNTSGTDLQHVAITHPVPAGWEILSTNADANVSYQDQRDDRMLSYIDDLKTGQTVNITLNLSATYAGKYYLPSVHAEAMYDVAISGCTNSGECIVK